MKRIVDNQKLLSDFKAINLKELDLPVYNYKEAINFINNLNYKNWHVEKEIKNRFKINAKKKLILIDTETYDNIDSNDEIKYKIIFEGYNLSKLNIIKGDFRTLLIFKDRYISEINYFYNNTLHRINEPAMIKFNKNGYSREISYSVLGKSFNANGPYHIMFSDDLNVKYSCFCLYSLLTEREYTKILRSVINNNFDINTICFSKLIDIYCIAKYFKVQKVIDKVENDIMLKRISGELDNRQIEEINKYSEIMSYF